MFAASFVSVLAHVGASFFFRRESHACNQPASLTRSDFQFADLADLTEPSR